MQSVSDQNVCINIGETQTWPIDFSIYKNTKVTWKVKSKKSTQQSKYKIQCQTANSSRQLLFESHCIDGQKEFTWEFEDEGIYSFNCMLNPDIHGVIKVSQKPMKNNPKLLCCVNTIKKQRKLTGISKTSSETSESHSENLSTCFSFQGCIIKERSRSQISRIQSGNKYSLFKNKKRIKSAEKQFSGSENKLKEMNKGQKKFQVQKQIRFTKQNKNELNQNEEQKQQPQ